MRGEPLVKPGLFVRGQPAFVMASSSSNIGAFMFAFELIASGSTKLRGSLEQGFQPLMAADEGKAAGDKSQFQIRVHGRPSVVGVSSHSPVRRYGLSRALSVSRARWMRDFTAEREQPRTSAMSS
jgi:hypothetical protein